MNGIEYQSLAMRTNDGKATTRLLDKTLSDITKNISQILDVLCKLNYLELRMIYVYIEKIVREKEERRVLKNDN